MFFLKRTIKTWVQDRSHITRTSECVITLWRSHELFLWRDIWNLQETLNIISTYHHEPLVFMPYYYMYLFSSIGNTCIGYAPVVHMYFYMCTTCIGYAPVVHMYFYGNTCAGYTHVLHVWNMFYTCNSTDVIYTVQAMHLYYMCETCIIGVLHIYYSCMNYYMCNTPQNMCGTCIIQMWHIW